MIASHAIKIITGLAKTKQYCDIVCRLSSNCDKSDNNLLALLDTLSFCVFVFAGQCTLHFVAEW